MMMQFSEYFAADEDKHTGTAVEADVCMGREEGYAAGGGPE